MSGLLFSLGVLLFTLGNPSVAQQVDEECNYFQNVEYGKTYYVFNPNYPNYYTREHNCKWGLNGTGPLNFTCEIFQLPETYNCRNHFVSVTIDGGEPVKYCGRRQVQVLSTRPSMTIQFTSRRQPFLPFIGGKFLCSVQQTDNSTDQDTDDEDCECGHRNPTRIVGGSETGVNEYPWMAGIVDYEKRQIMCGATIMSSQNVLTAAHCMINKNINLFGVVVGEHDVTTGSDTNETRLFPISEVYIHPSYSIDLRYDDIAVVKIVGFFPFSAAINRICLPFQHRYDSYYGSIVKVLGWGTTEFGGAKATKLMQVDINVISNRECSKTYPSLHMTQLCTKTVDKDACQFDSGGPVVWQNPTTRRFVLVGCISEGIGCAGDAPAINTRVGSFISWIQSVTPETRYCKAE